MDDLISRREALEAINRIGSLDTDADRLYAKRVFEALPSAQPEPRWIPCSERLPEENGKCLVTIHQKGAEEELGFELDDREVRKMYYNTEHGWTIPKHIPSWLDDAIITDVSAWMPLPEPYQAESEGEDG